MDIPSKRDIIRMKDRDAWRTWLEKNHGQKQSVWMLFPKKHTGKIALPYNDAVEEALCFGWIDSLVKKLDEESYIQKFTPRKKNSAWSLSNKKRVRAMIRLGKMTDAGLAKIVEAKKDGLWSRLDAVERLTSMPKGFVAALRAAPAARKNFRNMSPSTRKQFLWFIESAAREETRKKRTALVVQLLAANRTMSDHFYKKKEPQGPRTS
jgi:uncharacterized protein YdeI (YjbR/CyaY-like superfamily)